MKRKLTSLALAIAVMLSISIPAFAADRGEATPDTCPNELLWQFLLTYGGSCGEGCNGGCGVVSNSAQNDWNALLRAWLTRQLTNPQEAPQSEKPAENDKTAQNHAPQDIIPQKPTESGKPTESDKTAESATPPQTGFSNAYEQEVVRLVNAERAKYGLAALEEDALLTRTARMKSQDMHDKGYFDHNSPTYGSPFDLMKSQGIRYRTAGENIAMGYRTPEAVVAAWMASAGHRANILNASYTKIGVGYVASGNYWTQHFMG